MVGVVSDGGVFQPRGSEQSFGVLETSALHLWIPTVTQSVLRELKTLVVCKMWITESACTPPTLHAPPGF